MSDKTPKKIKNSIAIGIYISLIALTFAVTYLIFHKYIVTNQDLGWSILISGVAGLFEYRLLKSILVKKYKL